jgi:hypothetical protein
VHIMMRQTSGFQGEEPTHALRGKNNYRSTTFVPFTTS